MKVVKNKVAAPFREAEFDILYAQGISWEGSVLDSAIQHEIVTKRGSWLSYEGEQIGQGHEAARGYLEQNGGITTKLIAAINEKVEKEDH